MPELEEILKTKFADARHKAILNLFYTSNLLFSVHNKVFKQHGITSQQYNIMRILKGVSPESVSVGTIKERMLERESDVTRVIDNLVKKQLVVRRHCDEDRRVVKVSISEKGIQMLDLINPIVKEMESVMENLSMDEASLLSVLLDKVRNAELPQCCKEVANAETLAEF